MHKNSEAAGVTSDASAAAKQQGANAQAAFGKVTPYLNQYYGNLDSLNAKNQTMDPEFRKDVTMYGATQAHAGHEATAEDLGNLAKRTGENSSAYGATMAEDERARSRENAANQNQIRMQDSQDRQGRLLEIGKMYGLGPDIMARIYGSASGAQGTNLGDAAHASGNIYQPSPWASILSSAISGAASVGGAAVGGGAVKNCWIAEAIYGVNDFRTHIVREWLNNEFVKSATGRAVMKIYQAIGQQVAAIARKSSALRTVLEPLFAVALRRGIAWLELPLDLAVRS